MKVLNKPYIFWVFNCLISLTIFFYFFNYDEFLSMRRMYLIFLIGLITTITGSNLVVYYFYSNPKHWNNIGLLLTIWLFSVVIIFLLAFYILLPGDYNIN